MDFFQDEKNLWVFKKWFDRYATITIVVANGSFSLLENKENIDRLCSQEAFNFVENLREMIELDEKIPKELKTFHYEEQIGIIKRIMSEIEK